MARDYKNTAAKSKKEKKRPIGSWASFTSGLVLGLLVAFVVYVWRDKVPSVERAIEYHSTEQHHDDLGETVGDQTPAAEIASRETPKPRFDFYNILPEIEVKVPDWEILRSSKQSEEQDSSATYVLQVGSFKQHEDADRAKAQLALNGIEADIHRVVINGQDVWYRVHVGPFETIEKIQEMRKKLIEADREFIVLKIGDA